MLPFFTSHYSIGRSILTLDKIFELGKENGEVILVEDSLASLRKARKIRDEVGVKLRFGLRISVQEDAEPSKVIFFAKDDDGINTIRNVYTKAFTENDGIFQIGSVKLNSVLTCIPFYDSFIHKNIHFFGNHSFSCETLKEAVYLEEDNLHPFDYQISRALKKFTDKPQLVKSIFYEKRGHFSAFQSYKASCKRKQGGKQATFDNPNIEHLSSDRFSWEDYKNYARG